jgi:hypothetical protein
MKAWMIVDISSDESWAFSRLHLARVKIDTRPIVQHRCSDGGIELRFPMQTIEARSVHAQMLFEAILAGRVNHLACRAKEPAAPGSNATRYEQTSPDEYRPGAGPFLTGEIRRTDE